MKKIILLILKSLTFLIIFFLLNDLMIGSVAPEFRRDILSFHSDGYIYSSGISDTYYSNFADKKRMGVHFNSQGEHSSKDISYKKPPNSFRLLLLGDSSTFGQHMEEIDTWPYILEASLKKIWPYKNIEIINCAVIASSLIERLDIWNRRCSKYEGVDIVFMQSTISNEPASFSLFYGEYLGRSFHIFDFIYQYYRAQKNPNFRGDLLKRISLDEFGLPVFNATQDEINLYARYFRPTNPLYPYSHLARWIEHKWIWPHRLNFTENTSYLNYMEEGTKHFRDFSEDIGLSYKLEIPRSDVTLKILKKFQKVAAAHDSVFKAIFLPHSMGLNIHPTRINGKYPLEFSQMNAETKKKLMDLSSMFSAFKEKLQNEKIEYIDILEIFGKDATNVNYIPGDVHLNKFGNQRLAKILLDNIVEDFK